MNENFLSDMLTTGFIIGGRETNRDGRALHEAALNGDLESLQMLLASGSDVNTRDKYKVTALHRAVRKEHVHVVKVLIAAGVDIDAACEGYMIEISRLFVLDQFVYVTALDIAALTGNTEIVQILLDAYAQKNVPCIADIATRALSFAAEAGHANIVCMLLAGKAHAHGGTDDIAPLCIAAEKGHANVMQVLLSAGVDANSIVCKSGRTAIHYAVGGEATEP